MPAVRGVRTGDVVGLVSGVLGVVPLVSVQLFAVDLGEASWAATALGLLLLAYMFGWFGLRVYAVTMVRPLMAYVLRDGAADDVALVELTNADSRTIRLAEVHLMYLHGPTEVDLPPNTTRLNEYDPRTSDAGLDLPPLGFQLTADSPDLDRLLMTQGGEVRVIAFAWDATLTPNASTNVGLRMQSTTPGGGTIPLLWVRIFPEATISEVVPGLPGVVDRVFDRLPLAMVEQAFTMGLSPRIFDTESALLDMDDVIVDWPVAPERR